MTDDDPETEPKDEAVESRAHLLPEEAAAGSDDPHREAEVILEESSTRVVEGTDAAAVERRTSADTVEPLPES